VLFSSQFLFAQFEISSEMYLYSDDNIYNSAAKISDNIYNATLNGAYNFSTEKNTLQLYNQNSASYYTQNIVTSSFLRKFGVADNYKFSETTQLNLGANYSIKNNRDVFTILDFSQVSTYANVRYSFSETDFLTGGYVYYKNTFSNFSLFSHDVHKTFLRFNSSFETETSLILGADVSAKLYSEKDATTANETYQLNLFAQVGQSIAENTGLSAYFQLRSNLTQATRTFYYDNTLFYQDELFNDVFSNEGFETGISLTKLFSPTLGIKAEAAYTKREYASLPVFDYDGNILAASRKDNQISFGLELQKDLSSYVRGVSLHANWSYLFNSSNDLFYKYDNQLISVGFDYAF
jgi:hypothetical protein